jgi:hypothetical protein
MNASTHLTVLLAAMLLGACTTNADSTDSDSDEVGSHASLSGTYKEVGHDGIGLGYSSLTFESNGTYTAKNGNKSAKGTWKISKDGAQYQIKLADNVDGDKTLYESWDGYQLSLDQDSEGNISTNFFYASWSKKIPIGDVCEDNEGNSLGECTDDGNFACGPDGTNDNLDSCVPLD